MNLKKLTLKNAGPFEWAEFLFRAPITFLIGENESGKSTLKEWISGLLFGFSGKRALRASLIRWGEKEAVVSGELSLQGDRIMRAERHVREASASCLVESDGLSKECGDSPLPLLSDMDRDLYAAVYSLRVEDLRFPDASAWTALQSRLLSGEISAFLRPTSEVSAQWKEQALRLWRPDRRGAPTLSEHQDRLQELYRRLEESESRQILLKKLTVEEENIHSQLEKDSKELTRSEIWLEEARTRHAVLLDWQRWQRLLQQAGDLTPYEGLPADLSEYWKQIIRSESETLRSLKEAQDELERHERDRNAFTDREKRILSERDAIRTLAGRLTQYREDSISLRHIESEHARDLSQYRDLAQAALKDPESALKILPGLSPAPLQDSARLYAAALEKVRENEVSLRNLEQANAHNRMALWGLLPALFMLIAGIFLLLHPESVLQGSLIGGALIAAGLILGALSAGAGLPRLRSHLQYARKEARMDARKAESARRQLEDSLHGLSLIDSLWEDPRELLRQVESLRRAQEDLSETEGELQLLQNRGKDFEKETARLSSVLLYDVPGDPADACNTLTDALEQALRIREKAELNAQEALTARERTEQLRNQFQSITEERARFLALIASLPGTGPEEKIEELQRRRNAAERARNLADETFERSGTDLAVFGEQYSQEDWSWSEETILETQETIRRLRERRDEYRSRLGAITEERRSLMDQPAPSDIQSEINREDETIQKLTRERDQTALAFGLLRLGEEAWRQEHQPELIRRAGEYLAIITEGKYTRLFLPEGGKNLYVYYEKAESYLDPIEKRLSKGTLEQIYLALRLAMLDQLDPQGEPLPLLLDETLVNWDDRRAQGLCTVLDHLSGRRQILFFSCHPETPRKLGREDAEVILMEDAHHV